MPQHPLINYPPLDRSFHKTPKNRISVLVLSHFHSFILIPLVLSSRATVTEHRVHTAFFNIHFFGLLGPQNVKIRQNLNNDFFHDDNTFPIGKVIKQKAILHLLFRCTTSVCTQNNVTFWISSMSHARPVHFPAGKWETVNINVNQSERAIKKRANFLMVQPAAQSSECSNTVHEIPQWQSS